ADATCLPRPPDGVAQTLILNSPAPICDTSGINWTQLDNTNHHCNGQTSVQVTAPTSAGTSLACLEDFTLSSADGYASVYVTKGNGSPFLGVRQRQVQGAGATFTVAGYYLQVLPAQGQYAFYRLDGKTTTTQSLASGTLAGSLAQDFVMGIAY